MAGGFGHLSMRMYLILGGRWQEESPCPIWVILGHVDLDPVELVLIFPLDHGRICTSLDIELQIRDIAFVFSPVEISQNLVLVHDFDDQFVLDQHQKSHDMKGQFSEDDPLAENLVEKSLFMLLFLFQSIGNRLPFLAHILDQPLDQHDFGEIVIIDSGMFGPFVSQSLWGQGELMIVMVDVELFENEAMNTKWCWIPYNMVVVLFDILELVPFLDHE